ncbi:MAG: alcohol dehydrogenase catalytic domain-containing protein [Planctomycetes bacterium]|nr:alcohol dehydrogenase catalytic domain-containing protein [Planctomycetota bacterium]
MKAARWHGPYDLRVDDVDEPRLCDPRDALVYVDVSAICASDLHVWRGHAPTLDRGTILGHEFVGEIAAVGADVAGFVPGDRVLAPFSTSCGGCEPCARGETACCEHGQTFGWVSGGRGLQGAQAELVRVPLADGTLVSRPAELPAELSLLAGDALSSALFAIDAAALEPGQSVGVLGCGTVGLCALVAAQLERPLQVLAIDASPARLALAERLGAHPVPLDERALQRIRARTEGQGLDALVETTGNVDLARAALGLLRPGGTLCSVGVHDGGSAAHLPPESAPGMRLTGGRCSARRLVGRALELARARADDFLVLLSHRMPLGEAHSAYALFDRHPGGCTKVLLQP